MCGGVYEEELKEKIVCKDHPDAPHGFLRGASLVADRYVCECEFWEPEEEEDQYVYPGSDAQV